MESEEIKSDNNRSRKRRKRDSHVEKIQNSVSKKSKVIVEKKPKKSLRTYVGRYVRKEFEGYGDFLGKVVSYTEGFYRVDYEDGDSEDLESDEIFVILVPEGGLDLKLNTRKNKLDQLISTRYSKNNRLPASKGSDKSEIVETSKADDEIDVEPEVVEELVSDDEDTDSSSDSAEFVRTRQFENDVPLAPPPLLPPSSESINVPEECVSQLFSVYNFLRSFSIRLYLYPFQLDDFVGSLNYAGPNTLLDAVHFSIMRALRHHLATLSTNGSELASKCLRRLDWSLLDTFTWPVYVVEYLLVMGYAKGSEWKWFYDDVLDREYYSLSVSRKLTILQILCDDVTESPELRAEIDMRENLEAVTDCDLVAVPSENGPKRVHPRYAKTSACKDAVAMDIITNLQEPKACQQSSSLASGVTELKHTALENDEDRNSDECRLCGMDGTLLCCDGCPSAYHSRCIGVSKMLLPQGSWFCPECSANKKEPTLRVEVKLKGAEIFGADPYQQVFIGTCNHLLVLKSSMDSEPFSRYYKQTDIPKVLCALCSSPQHKTLYLGILKGILDYWGLPEDKYLSFPEEDEATTKQGEAKEGALVSIPASTFSCKETDNERDNCSSNLELINKEKGALSCLDNDEQLCLNDSTLETVNLADCPGLNRDNVIMSKQVHQEVDFTCHEQLGRKSAASTESISIPNAGPSNSTHQSLGEKFDVMPVTCASALGNGSVAGRNNTGDPVSPTKNGSIIRSYEIIEGRQNAACKTVKGDSDADFLYMGALFKPQSYINQYSLGDVAASSAASLAALSTEENRVSVSQSSSNPRKIVTENITMQVKAFSLAATRFVWPNPEKKLTDVVPRERCGWCYSCKTATTCKKGCLLNFAASSAVKGSIKILGAIRPIKNGEGNLPGIASYIVFMEESLSGLVVGPFLSLKYREQWRKRVEQASKFNALKALLLELEENIRLVALSKVWVKLVDDWLVESSVTQNATGSVGPTPRRGGRRNKKQLAISETATEPGDDNPKEFTWWRGGKLSKLVFQKGILPCPVVKKAARRGGSRKIPGVHYAEGSEIPKRSRRFSWRTAVEMSKNVSQLALQVRCLDLHILWSDLIRPEHNTQDNKGAETVISTFRNAHICDKKVQETKISYGLEFGNQKHLPSRVMKSVLEVEQNPDGKDRYWLSETQTPLYLIKEFEDNVEKAPLSPPKKDSSGLSELQKKQLKASRKDIFSYLMHKREKREKCLCASCQADVLLGGAAKCNACEGFCHKNCTKSSPVALKNTGEITVTCKKCFCAKAYALSESNKKQAISKMNWQGQEYQVAMASGEAIQQNNIHQPIASAGTQMVKKLVIYGPKPPPNSINESVASVGNVGTQTVMKLPMAGPKSAVKGKKVKATDEYFGVIWKKKQSADTGSKFRQNHILLRGNAHIDQLIAPKCALCVKPYNPDLMYICCANSCKNWYHADALQLKETQVFDIVGFKCCKCRRIRSPECPHADPKKRKAFVRAPREGSIETSLSSKTILRQPDVLETTPIVINTKMEIIDLDEGLKPRKTSVRSSKQGSMGMYPLSEYVTKQLEEVSSTDWKTEAMTAEENDPLLFSLERVEPILEIKSEAKIEQCDAVVEIPSHGPQKLPVRRQVKSEKDGNGGSMGSYHLESPPLVTNDFVGSELMPPEAEWDFPIDDSFKDEPFDFEGLNYDDSMEFEPQTYFSFTELLASDDDQLIQSDTSMMNMSDDWRDIHISGTISPPKVEQCDSVSMRDHQHTPVLEQPNDTVICCMCSYSEPAPNLSCEICQIRIHKHCSPWVQVGGHDRWRCGNCRDWQ
ncbi:hypothetical protein MKX01_040783 [Papaver californicum]|nr:hypothetical protein MKX01_040783 [Papaver californicum]